MALLLRWTRVLVITGVRPRPLVITRVRAATCVSSCITHQSPTMLLTTSLQRVVNVAALIGMVQPFVLQTVLASYRTNRTRSVSQHPRRHERPTLKSPLSYRARAAENAHVLRFKKFLTPRTLGGMPWSASLRPTRLRAWQRPRHWQRRSSMPPTDTISGQCSSSLR